MYIFFNESENPYPQIPIAEKTFPIQVHQDYLDVAEKSLVATQNYRGKKEVHLNYSDVNFSLSRLTSSVTSGGSSFFFLTGSHFYVTRISLMKVCLTPVMDMIFSLGPEGTQGPGKSRKWLSVCPTSN